MRSETVTIEESMELNLQGRTALITGASRGIGEAVAGVLAAEGCNLVLTARDGEKLEQMAREIRQRHGVQVATHAFDLSRHESIKALADVGGVCTRSRRKPGATAGTSRSSAIST
jgi:NADP-dependent 3-hydroxy acid dehydrogenase YdfG